MSKTVDSSQGQVQVIKDDAQYSQYLAEVRELMNVPPSTNSAAGKRLELLAVLIERYEEERFLLTPPDPVDAIAMRMAEAGLEQKDLARMLGSASRASEILNRRRALTLDQIRVLHTQLRIPAEVLLGPPSSPAEENPDFSALPFDQMIQRGWLGKQIHGEAEAAAKFREMLARLSLGATPVFMRRAILGNVSDGNRAVTYAWLARVVMRARESKLATRYTNGALTEDFLRQVAKLSAAHNGPRLAQEFLAMKGIVMIVEPHLKGMAVDGAILRDDDGTPIIGMTVRHDRLDNFWFTLMHELAHLTRHLSSNAVAFVDDVQDIDEADLREREADSLAGEWLLPRAAWSRSTASRTRKRDDIEALASTLCVHPAIIAGRIRKETRNWRLLSGLVGSGAVRPLFPETNWS